MTDKDIVLPEGFTPDKPAVDKFLGIINDEKLDRKGLAAALINLQAETLKSASEKGSQDFANQQQEWQNQVRNDPEIGGAKLEENLGHISRLVDAFGGMVVKDALGNPVLNPDGSQKRDATKVRQVMDLTGAGNHPEMIRFLSNVAAALVKEGKMIPGGVPPAPSKGASLLYDHPTSRQGA